MTERWRVGVPFQNGFLTDRKRHEISSQIYTQTTNRCIIRCPGPKTAARLVEEHNALVGLVADLDDIREADLLEIIRLSGYLDIIEIDRVLEAHSKRWRGITGKL